MENSCCIPVVNMSDKSVCYEKGRVLARGYACIEDINIPSKSCLATNIAELPLFTLLDLERQTNLERNIIYLINIGIVSLLI